MTSYLSYPAIDRGGELGKGDALARSPVVRLALLYSYYKNPVFDILYTPPLVWLPFSLDRTRPHHTHAGNTGARARNVCSAMRGRKVTAIW